jgi:AhpD family alkylhydroperoxidase
VGRPRRTVPFMTTTDSPHTTEDPAVPRLDFDAHAAGFSRAISHLHNAAVKELDAADIDPKLRELVRLRASQLNGCAYCIDMHSKDARAIGETEQRLYALTAWDDTPFFDRRERAALAFCEAVVRMSDTHVPQNAWDAVAAEFNEDEIAALISLIVSINAWNTVGVSTHTWEPGSYEG